MGKYARANQVTVKALGNFVNLHDFPGLHTLKIKSVRDGTYKNGKLDLYGMKFEAIESDNDDVSTGMELDHAFFDGLQGWQTDRFFEDIKRFVGTIVGVDPNEIGEEEIEDSVNGGVDGQTIRARVSPPREGKDRGNVTFLGA